MKENVPYSVSQTAFEAINKSFQKLLDRKDVRPGSVCSIQTFGSFGANWHPHIHCLATEGVFTPQGEFLPLPKPANSILKDIEERFRRLLLKRLHRAERLSEEFMNRLLQWNPSGFSVYAEQLVWDDEPQRMEKLASYITRAPLRVDGVSETQDSRVLLTTPPHPLTGETLLFLHPLDWVHAICQQIPDRGQHLTRFYGAYANRIRKALFEEASPDLLSNPSSSPHPSEPDTPSEPDPASAGAPASRASWARLIRKVFEVDPLICARCGGEMKVIAVVTEPKVVDRIVRHLQQKVESERAPPGALPESHVSSEESVPAR